MCIVETYKRFPSLQLCYFDVEKSLTQIKLCGKIIVFMCNLSVKCLCWSWQSLSLMNIFHMGTCLKRTKFKAIIEHKRVQPPVFLTILRMCRPDAISVPYGGDTLRDWQ